MWFSRCTVLRESYAVYFPCLSNLLPGFFSIDWAMKVPTNKAQTGALTFKIVRLDKAIIKANDALAFIDGLEKPWCKLFPNTPRRENPTMIEINSFGKFWISGMRFHENKPNTKRRTPATTAPMYLFSFGPASSLEQITVAIPAMFADCPPKKLVITENNPLNERIRFTGVW